MKEFRGIAASPGIAIGPVHLHNDDDLTIPEVLVAQENLTAEMQRYREAVQRAVAELERLRSRNGGGVDPALLDSHVLMLQDPDMESRIENKVLQTRKNVEWALQEVAEELMAKLSMLTDAYFKDRVLDIRDISRRILGQLLDKGARATLENLNTAVNIVTPSLLPSDAIAMRRQYVLGLAMDQGGSTNHTAILARSFGIPAVLGLGKVSREVHSGELMIVDGSEGVVILDPSPEVLAHYEQRKVEFDEAARVLSQTSTDEPAETTDGQRHGLLANIEIPEEVEIVLANGADGVGLYRSEFLFIQHGVEVSEDIQTEAYSRVLIGMGDRPVTIRTIDLGGDKLVPGFFSVQEENPLLGWRAIRFSLSLRNVFLTQLRALLRASVHGDLRIMFPMISGVEELEEALSCLEQAKGQLRDAGVAFSEDIPVGTMIEVPSAAMISDHLAKMVDFFSLGTNDLIQYSLAVDRGNERINHLYQPFHPGVLRLIRLVIQNAHAAGIPVAMCGEMAGDPRMALLLVGLGLDEFSMNALGLPAVKQVIRSVSANEARHLVDQILPMSRSSEIEEMISAYAKGRFSTN
ncbi:MAG: phosphoenolpyruvate--protein phosphotransferase [Spirochaetales bacterium]